MKKIVLFLLSIFGLNLLFSQHKLVEIDNFGNNKGNLKMYVYHPKSKDDAPKKLLIALHGCNQNAEGLNELAGLSVLADSTNTIVVFPQQKAINNVTNCFNWFRKDDFLPDCGENQSIFEMINYSLTNYSIDKSSIFIMGVSAGGVMSITMALTHPNLFKGVCSYAGGPFAVADNVMEAVKLMQSNFNAKNEIESTLTLVPKHNKIPKLITYHGLDDKIVNPINSDRIFEQWKLLFYKDKTFKIRNSLINNSLVSKTEFILDEHSMIVTYTINGLGHRYLVNPNGSYGGKLNANSIDVDYFATESIFKEFGILK